VRFPKGRVVDARLARPPSAGHCGVDRFNLHAGLAIRAPSSPAISTRTTWARWLPPSSKARPSPRAKRPGYAPSAASTLTLTAARSRCCRASPTASAS
jgi:hypothetical protein